MTRLAQQIAFLVEIDKLKSVLRRNTLMDGTRRENTAEHSWHMAMVALILAEAADAPLDLLMVLKMVLVHDIIEIDAGDTYAHDAVGALNKADREARAADRLFTLLPPDQAAELRALWDAFEARATPEARFAAAVDRVIGLLHNYYSGGKTWAEYGITDTMEYALMQRVHDGSAALGQYVDALIADAVAQGILKSTAQES